MGVAETGDEVLVGDPMYATYEGVVRAGGRRYDTGSAATRERISDKSLRHCQPDYAENNSHFAD